MATFGRLLTVRAPPTPVPKAGYTAAPTVRVNRARNRMYYTMLHPRRYSVVSRLDLTLSLRAFGTSSATYLNRTACHSQINRSLSSRTGQNDGSAVLAVSNLNSGWILSIRVSKGQDLTTRACSDQAFLVYRRCHGYKRRPSHA